MANSGVQVISKIYPDQDHGFDYRDQNLGLCAILFEPGLALLIIVLISDSFPIFPIIRITSLTEVNK